MSSLRITRLTGLSAGLVGVLLFTLAPVTASAASSLLFWTYIGRDCVYIEGAPADSAIKFVWRDSTGEPKARTTLTATEWGTAEYCSSVFRVSGGDILKAVTSLEKHRLVVPELSISVNRVTNRLKGTGPAGARLKIECQSADPFRHFEPCIWTSKVTVGSDGQWSRSLPFDIIGGADMIVSWRRNNDRIGAWGTAPFVNVTLGRPGFNGMTRSGHIAHIDLTGKATGTAFGDPFNGAFAGQFRNEANELVDVTAGDSVVADIAPDSTWVVPNVEGTASASTDVVSGRCYDTGASRRLVNVLLNRSGRERGWALLDTEADGSFSFNFLTDEGDFWSNENVRNGDKIVIRCMQAEGDWVQLIVFVG